MADKIPASAEEYKNSWFAEIIKKHFKIQGNVVVDSIKSSRATVSGDNFTSIINAVDLQVRVDDEKREYHFFVKHTPTFMMEEMTMTFKCMKLYEKEVLAYNQLFPAFENFISRHATDKAITIKHPLGLFAKLENDKCAIVMENLRPKGYKMYNKRVSMNEAHCRFALDELAKVHAVSFAYRYKQKQSLSEKWPLLGHVSFLALPQQAVDQWLQETTGWPLILMPTCIEQNIEGFTQEKMQKMQQFAAKGQDIYQMNEAKPEEEPFHVLLHRDFWTNNMLFKYSEESEEKPIDICLVDWQIIQFGNPAFDLSYFFYTSTDAKLRRDHLKDLLRYYHQQFLHYSKCFGVDPIQECGFTLEKLEQFMKEKRLLGFLTSLMMIPIMQSDVQPPDITQITLEEWMKLKQDEMTGGGNPGLRKRLIENIDEMIEFGLL